MKCIKRCFFIIVLLLTSMSEAHDKRNKFNIDEAIRSADMIFIGTVMDVSYASSQKGDTNGEVLPHTFVTYQINRLLKGNPKQANSTMTLRFLGGRGFESEFLYPSNYPLFDRGDLDFIFVKKNTISACPLYRCAASRFRSLDRMMFNEIGQQLILTPKQTLAFGKFEMRKEILTHQVSQTTLQAIPVNSPSEGPPQAELPLGTQFTVDQFLSFVEAKVARLYPPDVMNQMPIFPSADIKQPFTIRPLRAVAPKTPAAVVFRPPQAPTPEDLKEVEELEKNNFNPVLNR